MICSTVSSFTELKKQCILSDTLLLSHAGNFSILRKYLKYLDHSSSEMTVWHEEEMSTVEREVSAKV